jgi:cytidylate kinase
MSRRIIVAIDGPAGAGKSTIARNVAAKLGFVYIDTGAMYRAVALWAAQTGVAWDDMHRLEQLAREADIRFESGSRRIFLNSQDVTEAIRAPEIAAGASKVAAVPAVRRALVEKQRQMGASASIVMEGRDIGSIVFPDATVKIFLDAPSDVRAERRARDFAVSGRTFDKNTTVRELEERDHRDRTRPESPLVQAPDAVYIDSGGLSVEEVEQAVLKVVRDRTTNGKEYLH